jgi:hypothetical protein
VEIGTHFTRCYNAAMARTLLLIVERLLVVLLAAHRIWLGALCLFIAWALAPLWVAAIPAAFGLLFLIAGVIHVAAAIWR